MTRAFITAHRLVRARTCRRTASARQVGRRRYSGNATRDGCGGTKVDAEGTASANTLANKRPHSFALGATAGGMTGWLGWGAAQVLVPGLPGVGVSPLQASALSLCTLAGITLSSSLKFLGEGCADTWRALALGVPAVCCAPIGAVAAGRVSGRILQLAFHVVTVTMMPVAAGHFAWKLQQSDPAQRSQEEHGVTLFAPLPPSPTALESGQHAVFGGVCGFMSAFLGVAGLPWVVTWFSVMSDLTHQQCVGTTFMAVTPAVLTGTAAHFLKGNVPLVVFVPLALGATSGTYLGAVAHLATPTAVLQGGLGLSFAVAGYRSARTLRTLLSRASQR